MTPKSRRQLLVVGDCPVCGDTSEVVFLVGLKNRRVFVYCPLCGAAWADPVGYIKGAAWYRPDVLAEGQARAATSEDVSSKGWGALVRGSVSDSAMGSSETFYVP